MKVRTATKEEYRQWQEVQLKKYATDQIRHQLFHKLLLSFPVLDPDFDEKYMEGNKRYNSCFEEKNDITTFDVEKALNILKEE